MLEIDGSIGGGSVVRLALGLSMATGRAFRMDNVRVDRPNPGLKHQHLAAVRAAAEAVDAAVDGDEIGSQRLAFEPGDALAETVDADIPTAGSVGLLLQPLWIGAAAADHHITVAIDGGATAGKWAPPVHYLERVAFPLMGRHGLPAQVDIRRHGFYPEGGANVQATFGPSDVGEIGMIERGDIDSVQGLSVASHHLDDADVAERQRTAARKVVAGDDPSLDLDIKARTVRSPSPGSSILLWSDTGTTLIGADAVGEKGKRAEVVGQEAAEEFVSVMDCGAPLDRAMSDMVVPFLGLAGGSAAVTAVTDHVESNVEVTNMFVDREVRIDGRRVAAD